MEKSPALHAATCLLPRVHCPRRRARAGTSPTMMAPRQRPL